MIAESSYIGSWLFVFVIVGAFWYILDRRFGVRMYRWWHQMTHKDPLPPADTRGFIYNQKAQARFTAAVVLAGVQSVLAVITASVNPFTEIITFLFEVPVLMVGFYIGPWVDRLWGHKDEFLERIDKLESGEIDVKQGVKDAAQKAVEAVKDVLDGSDHETLPPGPEAPAPQEHSPEVKQTTPRDLIGRYLRR